MLATKASLFRIDKVINSWVYLPFLALLHCAFLDLLPPIQKKFEIYETAEWMDNGEYDDSKVGTIDRAPGK